MAEAVGYYVKHRRAPVAVYDEKNRIYTLIYVPVVSGESLSHAYQAWLAEEAQNNGLSVCSMCLRGELVKHGARVVLQDEGLSPDKVNNVEEASKLEEDLIKKCVVEDIGGFLVPTGVPVKRTSRFYIGYMVPALDSIKASTLDPQFHVRHAPSLIGRGEEFRETGQAMYYVELGTAVYTVSFALDVTGIGSTSFTLKVEVDPTGMFGAKRTRFLPNYKLLSAVAAVSKGAPFNVEPGHSRDFIAISAKRKGHFTEITGSTVDLMAYVHEDLEVSEGVNVAETPEQLISLLRAKVNEALKGIQ
jgi:CRISPR-associated protein Csa2